MKGSWLPNILYCACFAALILVPLLRFNWMGTVSEEKRMLASFPAWPKNFSEAGGFTGGIENWLKDRMGFRKQLAGACRWLEVSALGHSPAGNVALGERGSAFLLHAANSSVPHEEIREALGMAGDGSSLYPSQLALLERVASAIRSGPQRTVMLAVPTAPLFRYDDMPKFLRMAGPRRSSADHPVALALESFAKSRPEDARLFLFPLAEAEELAKRYAIYPRKNFHWSCSPFTVLVSELLAERLGQPLARRFDPEDFEKCSTESDLSHLMGIPFRNEDDLCPSGAFYKGMELTRRRVSEAIPWPGESRSRQGTWYKNAAIPAGKILVVGDSFNYALGLPLARNFREVLVMDYYGVMRETGGRPHAVFRHIRDAYDPDHVVFVRHNSFLPVTDMEGLEVFLGPGSSP